MPTLTVYFDTSFYVELDRTDDSQARTLAEALADLRVRPVVSHVLVGELALNVVGGASEQRLIDRIEALPQALSIPDDASWAPLRLQGAERDRFRELARFADRTAAQAMSTGQAAVRATPAEQRAFATNLGMPADEEGAAEFVREQLRGLLTVMDAMRGQVGESDPTAALLDGLVAAADPVLRGAPPDVAALRAMLENNPLLAATRRGTAVDAHLAKDDRRVVDVGLGNDERLDAMANLGRDSAHIHVFIEHRDVIDYLHVDKKRLAQIKNSADHPIRLAGVEHRCYSAATIDEHLVALERFRGEAGDR